MSSFGLWFVAAALAAAPSQGSAPAQSPSLGVGETPTFNKHVAPILWKNCANCHRPGEVGPFSLMSYDDAAKRADHIVEITASRAMPPWKAAHDYGNLSGVRRLTDEQLDVLARWAKAGAPQGDPQDLGTPPTFAEGWQLGTPDLVLEMPEEFDVPADGPDVYQCFVMPIPTTEHRTVAAAEFRPGNKKVVHHAIMFLDGNGAAHQKDISEPGPGYRSFGGPGIIPTGGLGSWAPGAIPYRLPKGIGKFLRHGSDMVLQIHYHPNGKPQKDRSKVGIYFTKTPAETIVGGLALMNTKLAIPPGAKEHKVSAKSEPLAADVYLLGLGPHLHLLGRQMKVWAETPTEKEVPLIWIEDWDFNWQLGYGFKAPVKLPKGSVIHCEATYDNTEDNPHNPNSPPKLVTWGEETTDEMCLVSILLITDTREDLIKIVNMRQAKWGGALAGGVEAKDLIEMAGGKVSAAPEHDAIVEQIIDRGFAIPQEFQTQLGVFDGDGNKKLSRAEFDQIPEAIRTLIRAAIKERVKAATGKT